MFCTGAHAAARRQHAVSPLNDPASLQRNRDVSGIGEITDPEIIKLSQQIIKSQEEEISEMKTILAK
jgi:hypothetical protein